MAILGLASKSCWKRQNEWDRGISQLYNVYIRTYSINDTSRAQSSDRADSCRSCMSISWKGVNKVTRTGLLVTFSTGPTG